MSEETSLQKRGKRVILDKFGCTLKTKPRIQQINEKKSKYTTQTKA